MDEELIEKESGSFFQSTKSSELEDKLCEVDLSFKCNISYSLYGTSMVPLIRNIPFQTECCSDEKLKSKVLKEVIEHLKRIGVIGFVTVLIEEENRSVDVI